ncbi:MAG: hypothetical protein IJA27_01775 [Lachnospiraceae bacterium]|nr:hypothetical protein [Lachnospiraceae bacterium]
MSKFSLEGIRRKKSFLIIAVVVLAIVILAFVYINREKNKVFKSYTVENSIEVDSQISVQYQEFENGV